MTFNTPTRKKLFIVIYLLAFYRSVTHRGALTIPRQKNIIKRRELLSMKA